MPRALQSGRILLVLLGAVLLQTRPCLAQFSQQVPKLVGAAAVGPAGQGISLALSADGNTAIVGGSQDNGSIGAAWIWTRNAGTWTQQGAKLVAADAAGQAAQGISVAI